MVITRFVPHCVCHRCSIAEKQPQFFTHQVHDTGEVLGPVSDGNSEGDDESATVSRSTDPRHRLAPSSVADQGPPFDPLGGHGTVAVPRHPVTGPTLKGARPRRASGDARTRMHFAFSLVKGRSCHLPERSGLLKARSVSHIESEGRQGFMWPPRRTQLAGFREPLSCCKCKSGDSVKIPSSVVEMN